MSAIDLEEELISLCPILFQGKLISFECPPGWETIVRKLSLRLEEHARERNPKLRVVQVKSKFGGLRYYLFPHDEYAEALVNEAEDESFKTCEVCGQPGKESTRRSWTSTLCDQHDT